MAQIRRNVRKGLEEIVPKFNLALRYFYPMELGGAATQISGLLGECINVGFYFLGSTKVRQVTRHKEIGLFAFLGLGQTKTWTEDREFFEPIAGFICLDYRDNKPIRIGVSDLAHVEVIKKIATAFEEQNKDVGLKIQIVY